MGIVLVAGAAAGAVLAARSPGGSSAAARAGTVLEARSPDRPCAARASTRAAARGTGLVEAKGPAFPVRTFVLTVRHGRRLTASDVNVTENGGPVAHPVLVPANQATRDTFGAVLVLDTSRSMHGKALEATVAAAQAFASQRNPNEQLGLIDFNRRTTVALPLTTSPTTIADALAPIPAVATGRNVYDAVARAEAMLTAAHICSGTIVVLSDGADTGSTKTLEQVAAAARNANIRINTIGVKNTAYKASTLKALAVAGRGTYADVQARQLAPLVSELGQQLSQEDLLRYISLQGPDKPIRVRVGVKGAGTAAAAYTSPALPSGP